MSRWKEVIVKVIIRETNNNVMNSVRGYEEREGRKRGSRWS